MRIAALAAATALLALTSPAHATNPVEELEKTCAYYTWQPPPELIRYEGMYSYSWGLANPDKWDCQLCAPPRMALTDPHELAAYLMTTVCVPPWLPPAP